MSQRLYVKAYINSSLHTLPVLYSLRSLVLLHTPFSPLSLFSTFSCSPSHSLLLSLFSMFSCFLSHSLLPALPVLRSLRSLVLSLTPHSPCSPFLYICFPVFSLTPFFPLSLFFVLYVLLFSLSLPTLPVLHSVCSLVLPLTVYLLATTIPTLLKNAYDIVIIFQWKLSCIMILILTFLF